jgi:hypothetical protein
MDSSILWQLWSEIEDTQASLLLKLNDSDLVRHLLWQLDTRKPLSSDETSTVSDYLHAKTSLIRDIALARMGM